MRLHLNLPVVTFGVLIMSVVVLKAGIWLIAPGA